MLPICVREDNEVPGPRPSSVCRCNICKPPDHKMVFVYGPDGVLMSTMAAPTANLNEHDLPAGVTLMKSSHDADGMEQLRVLWKKEKTEALAIDAEARWRMSRKLPTK